MPTSLGATLVLIGFVPGFAFLRLTEPARRSRHLSQVVEVLELAAAAVLTTGAAIVLAALLWPGQVDHVIDTAESDIRCASSYRCLAAAVLYVAVTSTAISVALAVAVRVASKRKYTPSVWFGVLAERNDSWIFASVTTKSGDKFAGAVGGTDGLDDRGNRDICLLNPSRIYPIVDSSAKGPRPQFRRSPKPDIAHQQQKSGVVNLGISAIILNEGEIRQIEVFYEKKDGK